MELPIARESYMPGADALVRAVKRSDVVLARTAAEETQLETATAFTHVGRPAAPLCNCATDATLPEGVDADAAAEEVLSHFASLNVSCHAVDAAGADFPPSLAAAYERRGYRRVRRRVYVLNKYVPPTRTNDALQIIPARAAYPLLKPFFAAFAEEEFGARDGAATQIAEAMIDHLDEPRLDLFIGRLNGVVAGSIGVVTLGNIGVLHPAYTAPHARGKGVAGTLADYLVDHCLRAAFEQVLIDRADGCPSIRFYESLGFKPVADYVRYQLAAAHG